MNKPQDTLGLKLNRLTKMGEPVVYDSAKVAILNPKRQSPLYLKGSFSLMISYQSKLRIPNFFNIIEEKKV